MILFTGGGGDVGISPVGFAPNLQGNFLMRIRDLFTAHRFRVAIVDSPSDRANLFFFRTTPEHAQDIAGVIAYLRSGSRAPVWLVGTSRGTVSAVSVAAQLHGRDGPDGIVLTSSLLQPGLVDTTNVFSTNLGAITVPTLVVHHELDGCFATLFADVPTLLAALSNAEDLQLLTFLGGEAPMFADPCGPFHHHGFLGIEAEVVGGIGAYILDHSRPGRRRGHERD